MKTTGEGGGGGRSEGGLGGMLVLGGERLTTQVSCQHAHIHGRVCRIYAYNIEIYRNCTYTSRRLIASFTASEKPS